MKKISNQAELILLDEEQIKILHANKLRVIINTVIMLPNSKPSTIDKPKKPKQPSLREVVYSLREVVYSLAQKVDEGFKQVNERIDKIETRMDKIETRMDKIEAKLETVIKLNNLKS